MKIKTKCINEKKVAFTLAEDATRVAIPNWQRLVAFTLAEVLITLGIIGVVAAMTLPTLIQNHREKENVNRLLKFVSVISGAVNLWKAENDCTDDVSTCLSGLGLGDSSLNNFAPFAAKMRVIDFVRNGSDLSKIAWLPDKAYNYYGEEQVGYYGGVNKITISNCAYLLNDGTIFSVDINPTNFDIIVDVNGKKSPNRVGNDIFFLIVGGNFSDASSVYNLGLTKDIFPYRLINSDSNVDDGICTLAENKACDPENIDPTKSGGASPTSYVLLNHKLPKFKF